MVKIIQKQKDCIHCGTCTILCPEFWVMDEDSGKVKPKLGQPNSDGDLEFEIDGKDLGCNQEAKDNCPVQAIEISK